MNMGAAHGSGCCRSDHAEPDRFRCDTGIIMTRIVTGDLGTVGQRALIDLLKEEGISIECQHMDCGIEIYDAETQDTHAGRQRLRSPP